MNSGRVHSVCSILAWAAIALLAATTEAGAHAAPDERIAALTLALQRHPDDALLWIERADEYIESGDAVAALRDLDRAATLAPHRPEVPLERGATLLQLGRAAEAERQLTLAIARNPASEQAHLLRARARLALHRARDAAADFERSIQLSARPSPDQFLQWSRALANPGTGGADDALEALDRGLVSLGESASLVEEAVRLECARGAWSDALRRVDRHPAAWGSNAALLARRGDVLRAAGREIEAQAEYSAALAELEAGPGRRAAGAASLETSLHNALRQGPPAPVGP